MLNTYLYPNNNPLSKQDALGLHKQPPQYPPCAGSSGGGGGGGGAPKRRIALGVSLGLSFGLIGLDIGIVIAFGITSMTGIGLAGALLAAAAIGAYMGRGC